MTEEIMNAISSEVYGVWFLIGAALVFWMQAGFAMVEAGFTRAKNTGNIIMKNLMDFCIGTVMFILIGFGLFLGEDVAGIFGKPGFDIFTNYANFDWSNFVFNLVFCATTATIVSGAMAERTKFLSYCVYSAVISAVIYPIEAHWTWGGGWLSKMGFHDFAGSNCIHMVGGICALIGAAILGPRIGKFKKQKDGSIKVGAFPGHNLALGAIGVILPVLPTTPFLLLASFCFAKGSERFHKWFTKTKLYKKHLDSFVKNRAMTLKTKLCILIPASCMLVLAMIAMSNIYGRVFIVFLIIFKYVYFFTKIQTIPYSAKIETE